MAEINGIGLILAIEKMEGVDRVYTADIRCGVVTHEVIGSGVKIRCDQSVDSVLHLTNCKCDGATRNEHHRFVPGTYVLEVTAVR